MLTPSSCDCGHAHGDEHEHEHHDEHQAPRSLAEQLWFPWRLIALNPLPVLVIFVISNVLFVALGALLRLLARLITVPGLILALLAVAWFTVRRVASLMAYPGQLDLVIREGEANFARLTKRRLQIFAEAAEELALVLSPRGSGNGGAATGQRLRFLQTYQNFSFALDTLALPVLQSLEHLERDNALGDNGTLLLSALRNLVTLHSQKLSAHCSELCSASGSDFEARLMALTAPKTTIKPAKEASMTTENEDKATEETETTAQAVTAFASMIQKLQTTIPLIGRPQTEAPATRDAAWVARELSRRDMAEMDSIATLELLRADMAVRFKGEQVWIEGYQGHKVDAMLLPAAKSGRDAVDRPAVLLCNPNGGLYEFHHLQMDWIKFYTSELDCHVLVYNYRGYGRCQGSPSPEMNNLDALALVSYLDAECGFKKIGVHGESIGGLVATYLACKCPQVSVLVADRTFANVPALAERMVASWAGTVVRWAMRWDTDNVRNYLDAPCAKLLCSDPCDQIILDGASLKSGVSLRIELGDETCGVPRQRREDGAPVSSDVPTGFFWPLCAPPSKRSTRRVSEAASRPQQGKPLTEATVARFSEAVLSVGRRAMEYATRRDTGAGGAAEPGDDDHVAIAVGNESDGDQTSEVDTSGENEDRPMLGHSSSDSTASTPQPVAESATFPEELLAVVWMLLARMDGYCGQCLLQAAESGGHDKIRAWTASLLTWGGRVAPERRQTLSLEPFDRNGIFVVPITVAEVHSTLQQLAEQYPALKFDLDVGFVVLMLEYLHDALQQRWRSLDDAEAKASPEKAETELKEAGEDAKARVIQSNSGAEKQAELPLVIHTHDPRLGYLLPLHCGHNKNYEEDEKAALEAFLRHVGFLETR